MKQVLYQIKEDQFSHLRRELQKHRDLGEILYGVHSDGQVHYVYHVDDATVDFIDSRSRKPRYFALISGKSNAITSAVSTLESRFGVTLEKYEPALSQRLQSDTRRFAEATA